jgi:hypothetical protein
MPENPLKHLYRDATPPADLKARVEHSLRESDALTSRGMSWRFMAAAALILAAVGGAYAAGRMRPVAVDLSDTYVLLLYEDSTYRDDRPLPQIIAEYAGWADSLARTGALVLAEKLGDSRYDVVAGGQAPDRVASEPAPTGMFIVRATDANAATAIARGSPHVRQGGRVVVRPIDRGG